MSTKESFKFSYALSVASQLGFLIVSSIGGFLALGLWLDKLWGTGPFMLLLGVFLGIGITIYEVHHLLKPLITNTKKDHD